MSNRARNFRRRTDDNDDTEAPSTTTPKTPSSTTTTTKPKKPISKGPKLLSFADDEENESLTTTTTKTPSLSRHSSSSSRLTKQKPSSSHKLSSSKDRIAPSSKDSSYLPSNVQPQAGTYTKEALLELQKNTKTLASSKPTQEPVIVLKGLLKPLNSNNNNVKAEANELEEEEEVEEERGFKSDRDDAQTRLGLIGIGKGEKGSIPDQRTIDEIRARRERLRQSKAAAPDFISLDGGSNHGEADGLSDEEPEFRGRIKMFGEKTEKRGVFEEEVEEIGGKEDDDDEDEIWEEEQYKKALGKRMDDVSSSRLISNISTGSNSSIVAVVHNVVAQQIYAYPAAAAYTSVVPSVSVPPSIGGADGVSQSLAVMPISQQAVVARNAVSENMRRLKESHGRTIMSLLKTDENLSASLLNITSLEKSLSAAGEKFIFMQKLRDFLSVICEFLQHKAPYIEELEEQMQKLHEERASAILERRTADNNDEMIEIEAAISAAMSVLNKGGHSADMVAAATSAAQKAVKTVSDMNLPVKLDDFGRDLNLQKRMDMTRRAEARKRRIARADAKKLLSMEIDGSYQRVEGESSTDESDSESAAYQSNCDSLLQTADQIFSDAAEEYSQLSVVKEKFERWKKDYSSSYRDAYMSISVPAIFSPYVRLEFLKWDPLREELEFSNMKWHSLLFDYGLTANGFIPDDADADLVPVLVEKVALPILHHEIAHCWDMLSTRETKNAVSATSLIATYISASSEAFGELLVTVRSRLADAVANVMVPTWSPLVMNSVPNSARVAAYRFGISIRLMRNISLWKDIFSLSVLEKLALDELLLGKILPHVRSIKSNIHDAITRTERIIASISGSWIGTSVTGSRSHKLQPLVDYVLSLGKALEKKHGAGVSESETGGLARRLKKILVELNEHDEARAILRTFHVKEAV